MASASVIIDAHIHVGSWTHADFLGRECDLAGTLAELARAGVGGAALMPSDKCENAALLADMRRAVAAGWPGPLWMFAWVRAAGAGVGVPGDPRDIGREDLAWVRANRAGVTGLKIHPSLSRLRITDDAFRPALELADELGLVVLLHCGRWAEIAGWAHAVDAAARWPRVKFLFAHAGGDTPPNAAGAARAVHERKLTNVWFEFSGLREYWVVERNVALLGPDRYLMGSDYPLAHPLMYMGAIKAMALDEATRAKILGDNALALFGRPLAAGGS